MATLTIYRDNTVSYNNWPNWIHKAVEYCREQNEIDGDAEFEKMLNCKIHSVTNWLGTGKVWYKIEFFDDKEVLVWMLKWGKDYETVD